MNNLILWLLENVPLILFILALIIILLSYRPSIMSGYENCFRWIVLLPVGINNLYYFVMHVFFSDVAASFMGWQNNPFQYEVGIANLGMGLIAAMAFKSSFDFRKAAVIANTCWLIGANVGHIYNIVVKHSFVLGNSGPWFWIDIFAPIILIVCLIKMRKPGPVL